MATDMRIPDSIHMCSPHSYPPFMYRPYATIYRDSIFRTNSFNSFTNETVLRSNSRESDWTDDVKVKIESCPDLVREKPREVDWSTDVKIKIETSEDTVREKPRVDWLEVGGSSVEDDKLEPNQSEFTPNKPMLLNCNKKFSKSEPSIKNLEDGMSTNEMKRRKSVTFADSEGMELTQVFYFKPSSILYSGDGNHEEFDVFTNFENNNNNKTNKQINFTTNFECGYANPKFQTFLHTQYVVLETLTVDRYFIKGWIHVLNLDFAKRVCVRWSQDDWFTTKSTEAVYEKSLPSVFVDIFLFKVPVRIGRTEFAIMYQTEGMEYWDNNSGRNYHVDISW